jgi:tetratricopeptide (TPR) repeat protein
MSRDQKENLSENELELRNEIMKTLFTNMSLCSFKKGEDHILSSDGRVSMLTDSIKNAKEALAVDKTHVRAHYRLAMAYKELADFPMAKETFAVAIKLAPNNRELRKEYDELVNTMKTKEREWFDKMKGFYSTDKLTKIEQADEELTSLREKIKRQTFDI